VKGDPILVVTLETDQDLIDHQLELEVDMLTGGVQRFRKARDRSIQAGRESHTVHGRAIIASLVDDVSKGIKEWLDNPTNKSRDLAWKRLNHMDIEQLAYLSLVSLVDSLSRKNTLLYVARNIGANIEMQDRLDRWLQAEGSVANNVIREAMKKAYGARRYGLTHKMNKDGYQKTEWEKAERVHIGFKMVDIIIQTTGIVRLDMQQTERKRRTTYVKPTEGTVEWINAFNTYIETSRPRFLPCVILPKKWDSVRGGGYHGHVMDELSIVRRR